MVRPTSLLLVSILLLAACGPAPYACTDPLGCLELPPGEPITIGALAALSGEHAPAGTEMLAAVQAAVDETGLILGHEVELVWEGTDCTESSARLAAARLALTSNLLAVIGPSCPADATYAVPALEDAGIAILTPANGGDTAYRQLVEAIQKVVIQDTDGTLHIPRQTLTQALNP